MKLLMIGIFSCCIIFFQSTAVAMGWEVNEKMMQEMANAFSMLEKTLKVESPCIEKTAISRISNQNGIRIEITYKQEYCRNEFDVSTLYQQAISNMKSSPSWSGMIDWFQRGFFINYVFKLHNGTLITEFQINRKALFWQPWSQAVENLNDSKNIRITTDENILSFHSKSFTMPNDFTPGYPLSQKYCDIEFNQERYFFRNDKNLLSVSFIKLVAPLSDEEQLQCINKGDFAIQTKQSEQFKREIIVKKVAPIKNTILVPAFKIIETTENGAEINYALSALIGNHIAVCFSFSGPNSPEVEKLFDDIINSVHLESR